LEKIRYQMTAAALAMIILIFTGTLIYHRLEDWTWVSSFYFTIVTLTTEGYGDLVPTSEASRLFTAIFILVGATIVLAAIAIIGTRYLELRGEKVEERQKRRRNKS
jgi:voltage-gated potassium channel Kch